MGIKGLTDRGASFPRIGTIRKGAPMKEGDRHPRDLTYFRVEFDEQERQTAELFRSIYGSEPDEIAVVMPFAVVEDNFDAWEEGYVARGLVFRGDGERVLYKRDGVTDEILVKNGEPVRDDVALSYTRDKPVTYYETKNGAKKPVFAKPVGRLKIMLAPPMPPRLAYLVAMTSSIHDIMNLSEQLRALERYGDRGLVGIPLKLRRRPVEISAPIGEDGRRVRITKHLLSIEAAPTWVERRLAIAESESLPQLPAGETVDGSVRELAAPTLEDTEDESFLDEASADAPETDGGGVPAGVADDPQSRYWWTVSHKARGLSREDAEQIVSDLDGDFEKALEKVVAQHVPPEKASKK